METQRTPAAAVAGNNAIGLALWGAAVSVALAAQYLFTPLHQLAAGRVLFLVAACLAVKGMRHIDRDHATSLLTTPVSPVGGPGAVRAPSEAWRRPGTALRRRHVGAVVVGLGLAACIAGAPVLTRAEAYAAAHALWLLGLTATVAGVALFAGEIHRPGWRRPESSRLLEVGLLFVIITAAALLRFPWIDAIPPDVNGDEAQFGLQARRILSGEVPTFFLRGDNRLGDALNALSMRLFGDDLEGLRLGSAVWGTASVLLLYLLARRLFGTRPALIAAGLLAAAQWHVHFSRNGITCMHALVATVLLLYLTVRALDTRRFTDFALAGVAAGVCLHVYYPARLAIVLAVLYGLHRLAGERIPLSIVLPRTAIAGAAVLAVIAPFALSTVGRTVPQPAGNPGNVGARAGAVFVLTEANRQHQMSVYGVDRVELMLAKQAQRTLEAFNLSGETSAQYGRAEVPLLDFWTGALLVPGALVVTVRLRHAASFVVASWIWLTLLLGAVLTLDAPFAPRIVPVIPALMIPPALMVDGGWRAVEALWGRRGALAFAPLGVGVVLLALVANYQEYFQGQFPSTRPSDHYTALARHIRDVNASYRVYLLGRPYLSLDYVTLRFLTPRPDGVAIGEAPIDLPLRDISREPGKGAAFVIDADWPLFEQRLREVQTAYPGGRLLLFRSPAGVRFFVSYLVDHDQLTAALRPPPQ